MFHNWSERAIQYSISSSKESSWSMFSVFLFEGRQHIHCCIACIVLALPLFNDWNMMFLPCSFSPIVCTIWNIPTLMLHTLNVYASGCVCVCVFIFIFISASFLIVLFLFASSLIHLQLGLIELLLCDCVIRDVCVQKLNANRRDSIYI